MSDSKVKNEGGGLVLRRDLTLMAWHCEQAIEIRLTPPQALAMSLNLVDTVRAFLEAEKPENPELQKTEVSKIESEVTWLNKH